MEPDREERHFGNLIQQGAMRMQEQLHGSFLCDLLV